ncbi:mitotic spindle checkpoint component mad2 [Ascobolus immersus RN42]|uniref:Mitotic spindle checkpoint component mad2 n=1 Tax=Ascobolus immersus RN42 TaxID=1160509 RepID=A0A3N4HT89_ASCIM|nr:mitotic spindle checkpoint component mad2 [Ascobolus immersus RN42]
MSSATSKPAAKVKSSTSSSSKPASSKTSSSKTGTKTKKTKTEPSKEPFIGEDGVEKVHRLSLKGSSRLVTEFFEYSINTILFQRGVYPAEDFTPVKKYGLNMLVSSDDQVKAYIKKITSQLSKWMYSGSINKLVIVISSRDDGIDIERWQFDVEMMGAAAEKFKKEVPEHLAEVAQRDKDKPEKEIQEEIQGLFRQITASVTFLPMLDGRCTFNVLVYADGNVEVPVEWGDSDPREIENAEKVALRTWGTNNHRVQTAVSYRLID